MPAVQFVFVCLLSLHLLAVNLASGAPFVCIWLGWRAHRGDASADAAGRLLVRWALDALSLGVLLGVALGALFWWLDRGTFLHALAQIEPRRLAFGGIELLVYYGLMAWYLASWGRWNRLRWMHPLLAFVAGTNLVYHFPTLFTAVAIMSERGAAASGSQPFVNWLRDPELLARVGHFCLASLAVTGAAVMCAARSVTVRASGGADRVAVWGAHWILWPTLCQLPLGLWVLLQIREPSREVLLGGDLLGTVLFGAAMLAVLSLLHQLGNAILGSLRADESRNIIALVALIVVLMVGARDRSRRPLLPTAPAAPAAASRLPPTHSVAPRIPAHPSSREA